MTTYTTHPRRMRRMLDRDARAGRYGLIGWSGLMLGVGLVIGMLLR